MKYNIKYIIPKYKIRLLYTPHKVEEAFGNVKERTCSFDIRIFINNFEILIIYSVDLNLLYTKLISQKCMRIMKFWHVPCVVFTHD